MATSNNNLDLSKCAARNKDGSIDLDKTLARVKETVIKFNSLRENDLDVIAAQVDAVFADHVGVTMSMEALTGFVLRNLNANPSNWGALSKRVQDYVRSFENSKFLIRVGKGVSRIPPTT